MDIIIIMFIMPCDIQITDRHGHTQLSKELA